MIKNATVESTGMLRVANRWTQLRGVQFPAEMYVCTYNYINVQKTFLSYQFDILLGWSKTVGQWHVILP